MRSVLHDLSSTGTIESSDICYNQNKKRKDDDTE